MRIKSDHQYMVERFMKLAGQELPEKPCIPSEGVRILRAKLTFEEAVREKILEGFAVDIYVDGVKIELNSVFEFRISDQRKPDLVKILDGCCDTAVVNTGDLSACGISDMKPQRIIDESNLEKFEIPVCCGVAMTHTGRGNYNCLDCLSMKLGPYRRDDGKFMKGPDWKVPDLGKEIERQLGDRC